MQLDCPRCGHPLHYTDVVPRFCSNCGVPLSVHQRETVPSPPGVDPGSDPDATVVATGAARRVGGWGEPSQVGGYRLVRKLGSGGMGTVYEGEDGATGRHVALKLIRAEFADSPDAVERFRREGRLASTIIHPRCVFVLAADEEAGRPYIVMELMPGRTLDDLVRQRGPLPVEEAIGHALDVIEGLQEAHRGGVIHRDVKPSNCFLDAEGRVKVGDFGLAKSLIGQEFLTRSGAFLGTLLFASPEQIRKEAVGPQSDVYSVSATLYYLLTGRAPFESDNDPAATLARTVTDPPQPMRTFRPDLPRALDEVVLRGLARSRRQRWHDLEELRLALLPFHETTHTLDEVGWRVSAYLCDLLLVLPAELALNRLVLRAGLEGSRLSVLLLLSLLVSVLCGLVYFGLTESLWGCTPGKYLMRLRVRESAGHDRPRPWRAALRTLWFYLFKDLGPVLVGLALVLIGAPIVGGGEGTVTARVMLSVTLLGLLPFASSGAGLALLAVTMRRRTGYRGVHEWASGTEVYRLPEQQPRFDLPDLSAPAAPGSLPAGVPDRVGAFNVRAAERRDGDEMVLDGADPVLGRPVWLWLRRGEGALPAARRDLARAARPRWLAGGMQDGWRWDAYVASAGCLLGELVARQKRLDWADTLLVLEQLSAELEQAVADGTLPPTLSVQQVWVRRSGRVLLLDVAPRAGECAAAPLDLLRQTAVLALEGRLRTPAESGGSVQAPLPGHAAALLDRLLGVDRPFTSLAEVRQALAAAHEEPMEISRPRRALEAAVLAAGMAPGLLWMFLLGPAFLLAAYMMCVVGEAACEYQREVLRRGEAGMVAVLVSRPGLPGQAVTARVLAEERRQEEDYGDVIASLRAQRRHVLESWNAYLRRQITEREHLYRQQYVGLLRRDPGALDEEQGDALTSRGEDLLEGPAGLAQLVGEHAGTVLLLFAAWPLVWAAWALLTRGGLAPRLAGIALRQRNGRPAARWRCAWRSLVVWLPVLALLLLSLGLDVARLAQAGESSPVRAWLAWWAWWQALLVLPVYIWLGVRWPHRGVHDWLAGVFPVPR